ncbi:MAG: ArnT family glycosyltransferase [Vulcanimicrobiaceae bacterium]
MTRTIVCGIVAAVTLLRAIAAWKLPMTGDEAYYWEWSRRLAFGYTDHPPMVAWTIAAFAFLGHNPFAVRIGFVLCGLVATFAIAACATELANDDRRAGRVAALALTLMPIMSVPFASASPDGPYLMFWCLALWLAARAFMGLGPGWFVLLGIAMGGAILSRMTAFALLFGIAVAALAHKQHRAAWRDGLWVSFVIAGICFAPFLIWNAQHHWETIVFTFATRHVDEGFSVRRVLNMLALQAGAFSPVIWFAAILYGARTRVPLIFWSAVPLYLLVTAVAFFERVEINWFYGCFASACAGLGLAWCELRGPARFGWTAASAIPAAILTALIFVTALASGPIYRLVRDSGAHLADNGPFEIYTYDPLAHDVRALAQARDAIVMTDGYGFSSVMDFDADITPVVIGYDAQGAQARSWYGSLEHPTTGLFVDKVPLDPMGRFKGRKDFRKRFDLACESVRSGGVLQYTYAGAPPRPYYLTWCDGMKRDALAILRWQQ